MHSKIKKPRIMGRNRYCLMCLGTEVKLYPINSTMKKMYYELISVPHKRNTQLYSCYVCSYLLQKYEKFKTRCRKAYNILCSLSAEPFKVPKEMLTGIDRKQNDLGSMLTSLTFTDEYQPNQDEGALNKEFNIEKVKTDPTIFNNALTYNENDPLQVNRKRRHEQDVKITPDLDFEDDYQLLVVKSGHEHESENDVQVLNVKSTPEHDIDNDYQFNHTFELESSNYNSNTGSMLWLTIQSKDNPEVCNNERQLGSPVPNQGYYENDNNCPSSDNYLVQQKVEIEIEPYNDDETPKKKKLKVVSNRKSNKSTKSCQPRNKNKSYDVSNADSGSLLTLDSKIMTDHMTVTDLTPEDARHEFLLRKKSSNYTRNPFKCDLCYRGFNSKISYETHLKKHSSKNGSFQCDICKFCFISKAYLNQHRIRMHRRKFSCKMCPYVCFAQTQCNAHILSHRGTKYTCKKCGMSYRYRNSLLTHINVKHNVEFVCEFCGSALASEHGLYRHKHMLHRQEKNERLGPQCTECDIHFASELAWKRHRVLCSRHEVQFGCKVCGEIFEDSESLRDHGRQHGRMDYRARQKYFVETCTFCKKALPNKKALKNHILTEHPTETIDDLFKPKVNTTFVCEFCGKAFLKRFALVTHQRKHSDEMPYSCPDCGMRTKYKVSLRLHRRIHTGEYADRYQCDLCGRPFSDKSRLVRHMKLHMGIRPYKCVACDKTFLFRCDERTHYKHVHDKEPYPKKDKSKTNKKKVTRARLKVFDNI